MLIQLETQSSQPKPRSVFYSYSHKDEEFRDELDSHLKLLKRDGFISTWHDRKIKPGDEWDHVINENLNTADVILFLVSHHFLASQYCRDIEVKRAMERYQNHEAILIPIIIKPCVWTSEAFAKLQVLPKNCRPLTEWPDSGFAQVAEDLRTMLVDMLYPQKPNEYSGGQHGNWIIKMRNRTDINSNERAKQVVNHLREFTEDYSITLQATASTQIVDGEKNQIGQMLILTGSPEAFSMLDKAQRDGQLASEIDEDLISLYVVYGATVQGSSTIGASIDISEVEGQDLILRPGRKVQPAHFWGLDIPKGQEGGLNFLVQRGDIAMNNDEKNANYQQLMGYFKTSLAIKDEFQWVNLSAYESDRMLPKELSGTEMGRNLLSLDCLLKQLTASFMHPDSPVGREYWDAVYSEAFRLFGTSKIPIRSFQKVWVLPSKAIVFVKDGDTENNNDSDKGSENKIVVEPGHVKVYVLENALDVHCEEDIVALNKNVSQTREDNLKGQGLLKSNCDFTLDIFRRIVLPKLQIEVNESEHFTELRRIYSAMVLATWLKMNIGLTQHTEIHNLVDSGDPNIVSMSLVGIQPVIASKNKPELEINSAYKFAVSQHNQPTASAFDISENVEFFNQYVRLFKNGIFRCARNEVGDSPDERIIRVYFSGAIDFRNMSNIIEISGQHI